MHEATFPPCFCNPKCQKNAALQKEKCGAKKSLWKRSKISRMWSGLSSSRFWDKQRCLLFASIISHEVTFQKFNENNLIMILAVSPSEKHYKIVAVLLNLTILSSNSLNCELISWRQNDPEQFTSWHQFWRLAQFLPRAKPWFTRPAATET